MSWTVGRSIRNGWSIVIVSCAGVDSLKTLVGSIDRNSRIENHEIVVHVNGSDPDTIAYLDGNESIHAVTSTEENIGLCKAANLVSKNATKDWILLIDDDMYCLPGWDEEIAKFYDEHNFIDKVWLCSTMVESVRSDHAIYGDYGNHPSVFRENKLLEDFEKLKGTMPLMVSTWCPTLMTRKMWESIGGYSEEFSPGIGSEIDIAKKAWDYGVRNFVGVSTSLVYHFMRGSTSKLENYKQHTRNRESQFQKLYGMSVPEFRDDILGKNKPWLFVPPICDSRVYISESHKVAYVRIPKCASTSITAGLGDSRFFDKINPNYDDGSFSVDEFLSMDGYYSFCFVRNPFDRIKSCWQNRVAEHRKIYNSELIGLTFGDFLEKIVDIPDEEADQHFRSLTSFVYRDGKLITDFVGKVENINADWSKLCKDIGIPLFTLNRLKVSKRNGNLNKRKLGLIRERYREDFINFGYDMEKHG